MSKLFLILFLHVGLLFALQAQQREQFRIVGYYSLDAAMSDVEKSTLKKLTHVNLWFLNPDSLGNFTRDLSGLTRFIESAHRKNVKVLFSIGGGSKQPQYKYLLKMIKGRG